MTSHVRASCPGWRIAARVGSAGLQPVFFLDGPCPAVPACQVRAAARAFSVRVCDKQNSQGDWHVLSATALPPHARTRRHARDPHELHHRHPRRRNMTSARQDAPVAASTTQLTALRGNCMGAAVLLIIQFVLGVGVSLYVTLPEHKSFLAAVFGSATLAAHAVVALVLVGASIGALVRAIRSRRGIVLTSVGLAAILAAGIAGSSFVGHQSNGASFGMALATAVAMFCYLAAVFSLR